VLSSRPGELPFRTWAEMEAAGYRWSDRAQCMSVRCLAAIVWVWTPSRRKLAIDERTCQPHALTCKDPGWYERRRERQAAQRRVKTSARRRAG